MKLKIKVTPIGEPPFTVETNLFTVVAWERKFKRPASDMATSMGAEWLAFLAYEACKQSGIAVSPVFDDFLKKIEAVDAGEAETENPPSGEVTAAS